MRTDRQTDRHADRNTYFTWQEHAVIILANVVFDFVVFVSCLRFFRSGAPFNDFDK